MVASIQEAKAQVIAEKNKVVTATRAVIGSRVLLAALTMLMLGFGVHAIFFPDQLPPVAGLNAVQAFSSSVDFGVLGEKAQEAGAAAVRQGAPERLQEFLTAHTAQFPLYNWIGFLGSLVLLVLNLFAAAGKWKGATGVGIGAP